MTDRSDRELLATLNTAWQVAGPEDHEPSVGRRLLRVVRRLTARLLRPQEAFNAGVVRYLNANLASQVETERQTQAALEETRTALGILHQSSRAHSRELDRLGSRDDRHDADAASAPSAPSVREAITPSNSELDTRHGHTYVGFEDHFRGAPVLIRERQADYVGLFEGASNVLDVGCGRGEFLTLLRERGISARGIDVNDAMVASCREQGLDATVADALGFLAAQPDGSLGGLFAAQVVEHLQPNYLINLIGTLFDKLRPGAPIVLETINPTCWSAFFDSYIRDFTHVRPVHPETLKYLVLAQGFEQVEVRFRSPYPAEHKLQRVRPDAEAGMPPVGEPLATTFNSNVDRINDLLFSYLDYAVVAKRP